MLTVFLAWKGFRKRFAAMSIAMQNFSQGDYSSRMVVKGSDELDGLARGFNSMAERLGTSAQAMEAEIRERSASLVEAEKLALLGGLVAGVAHEINTPVGNSITVATWLSSRVNGLLAAPKDASGRTQQLEQFLGDAAEAIGIIESSLSRTANLIQTFKKVGAQQVVGENTMVSLPAFFEELSQSLMPTYKRHPQKLVIDCEADLQIHTNPGMLFQIFSNLVINSYIHAFPDQRPGNITVGASRSVEKPGFIAMSVRDDGIGISQEIREKIFVPFFTTKKNLGGTGLGLSISWNLVKNIGGELRLDTAEERGSRFYFDLPDGISVKLEPLS